MLPDVLLRSTLSFADSRSLVSFAHTSRKRLVWCKRNVRIPLAGAKLALELVRAGWTIDRLLVATVYSWKPFVAVWTRETKLGLRKIRFLNACGSCHQDLLECTNLQLLKVNNWSPWDPVANNKLDFSTLAKLQKVKFHTTKEHTLKTLRFNEMLKELVVDPSIKGALPFIEAAGLTKLEIHGILPPAWNDVRFPCLEKLIYQDAEQGLEELLPPLHSTPLTLLHIFDCPPTRLDLRLLHGLRELSLATRSRIELNQRDLLSFPRTLETLDLNAQVDEGQAIDLDVLGHQCPDLVNVVISLYCGPLSVPKMHLDVMSWRACVKLAQVYVAELDTPLDLPERPEQIWPSLKYMELTGKYVRHEWWSSDSTVD